MNSIQQGDQYGLPVSITIDGKKAIPGTPELGDDTHIHVDDARFQIGEVLAEYSADTLEYDSENDTWVFLLDENASRRIGTGRVVCQAGVRINSVRDSFIYTPTQTVQIDRSLIREKWGAD